MRPTTFHKFSSFLTSLVLFTLLGTIALGACADFQSTYETGKVKTEIPEPEDTKSEKDEKKVEEDTNDKISSEANGFGTSPLLLLSSDKNTNEALQSHLPEITTPPPERISFL